MDPAQVIETPVDDGDTTKPTLGVDNMAFQEEKGVRL